MPCSKKTLALLFYNVSSSSLILLLFLYFSSTLLFRFLNFIGRFPIINRSQNGYDYMFTDEEEEEGSGEDGSESYYYVDCTEKDHHLVADIINGGESLVFCPSNHRSITSHVSDEDDGTGSEDVDRREEEEEEREEEEEDLSVVALAGSDESAHDDDVDSIPARADPTEGATLPVDGDEGYDGCVGLGAKDKIGNESVRFDKDEKFLVFKNPIRLEPEKLLVRDEEDDREEEIFGDSCTVGSTSKSSSEWRSSIKDSGTDDPFSSSSRRSCPRWESYTVFQKYDEEMMFLNRISAQKLQETESLRSIKVCPRSISDRIVHKLNSISKNPADKRHNPYHELEAAYVAQICLTWEALNCNYTNFNRKRASHQHQHQQQHDSDPGCPANVAQQFQQFQVLLQRYVENEPYEQGRRPEVYARMRLLAPKLLLVPEYRDSEDDHTKEEGFDSRISSAAFLMIMEDGIRTFMNFLRADKERTCRIISALFKRRRTRGSVDPALLNLMKKVNHKKEVKLKDIRRARKCLRRRRLKVEEEMEILMGLIDLKVVSRVLKMSDISEQQLHWCEEKMSKVRVLDGKLQRDSLPLFFPAH